MTHLQLDDSEPFKLDPPKFPRWCADGSCGETAHQPFLFAISPVTLAWDANFYQCPGLGASLVAFRGSLFVRLVHMDTVRSWGNRDLASLLTFLNQTEFHKKLVITTQSTPSSNPTKQSGPLTTICRSSRNIPCEGEKSVQKAAVSLLLPTCSKLWLNSLTATNKTDTEQLLCKSVFVQYADKAQDLEGLADTNFAVPRHGAGRNG